MSEEFEFKIISEWDEDEIVELYKSGNWWKDSFNKESINKMIKGSFAFVVVINNKTKKAIGMGRLISDGVSDAYIQDLVIKNEYRNKGLGKKLVKFLVNHCLNKNIFWIGLIAEPGSEDFYKPLGLKQMKDHIPMLYRFGD